MDVAVQIEFLVTPQLADPASPQYGEWPPAPDRVFQALVATAAETGKDLRILGHLESAPDIQATDATITRAPRRYVPDNFRRSDRYHQGAARYLRTGKGHVWFNRTSAALFGGAGAASLMSR